MRGNFRIHYPTGYGQRVEMVLDGVPQSLQWIGDGWWGSSVDLADLEGYSYRVVSDDAPAIDEPLPLRRVDDSWPADVIVIDRWRETSPARLSRQSAFYSRSRQALYPAQGEAPVGELRFDLLEPWVPVGKVPAVVGSVPQLGSWDVAAAIPMVPGPYPHWAVTVDLPGKAIEYKYVLLAEDGSVESWEDGPNRLVQSPGRGPVIIRDEEISGLPGWRGAGVAVPVFALRTAADVGVGQFTDLIPFADWAAEVGLSVIQLLPVNDTVLNHDWDDSYPYNPVSVHALHLLYLDLEAIAGGGISGSVATARSELNDLSDIDYPKVMAVKTRLARQAYSNLSESLDGDEEFDEFVDEQWEWLGPYSAWCVYRDRFGTPEFTEWAAAAEFDRSQVDLMASPGGVDFDELRFHWFVQFHLHRQLNLAADHVRSRGIALKGDIPIGVAPQSVEVWIRPELFRVGTQTGAPPDAFARRGQNWGFPTYEWDRMAQDGFEWWRSRLEAFAAYVDVYRIDHVLGFFRIWEIPLGAHDGTAGHFTPSLALTAADVGAALDIVDIAELTRPRAADAELSERFDDLAGDVAALFISAAPGGESAAAVASQKEIREAFSAGAFAALSGPERADLERRLLDYAIDVLLVEVDAGYAPAIGWRDTTHYRLLAPTQQEAFDVLALDFFHHRHTDQWSAQGRRLLGAIVDATNLLVCGEDLGMVPDVVPEVMNEIGLLSLEIERMPKRLGEWLADPADAPYLSVVSPGTHDTATLRQWWEGDPGLRERYWETILRRTGEPPAAATQDLIATMIERQLASPAMLCIIPIADVLATDPNSRCADSSAERINDPANPHNKWRYRMGVAVEDLIRAGEFNDRIRSLIRSAGR